MNFAHYRRSTIGQALTNALTDMVVEGSLDNETAENMMFAFDEVINAKLADTNLVTSNIELKGKLNMYRSCDQVWEFHVQEAAMPISGSTRKGPKRDILEIDRLMIVAMDGRQGRRNKEK